MEEITLMEHHLLTLKSFREIDETKYKFDAWLFDKVYGEGNFKKTSTWAKSFDPDNTLVKIVPDENLYGGANMDALCEQGCIYIENCKKTPWSTMLRVFKEKPLIFPYIFVGGLYNGLIRKKPHKRGLMVGGKYSLKTILEAYK